MATLLAPDAVATLQADPLPDFVLIRTDEIDLGERLRPVDPIWAQALGHVMLREGQRTPIEVCRLPGRSRWTLVTGGHRFAGAQTADIVHLRAEIVSADRDTRRSREISENLWRWDLAPLDRAALVAEAVAIQKRRVGIDPAKDGRAVSAAVRWRRQVKEEAEDATATLAVAYGLSDQLVEATGLSARTIRDDLMLYRRLPASIVATLRADNHPVLWHFGQLKALAKLDEPTQRRIVARLCDPDQEKAARSVGEALAQSGSENKPAADPAVKRQSTIIGTLQRMSAAELVGFCHSQLFHRALPAEAQRLLAPMLRGASNERDLANDAPSDRQPENRPGREAGLDQHGRLDGASGADALGQRGARSGARQAPSGDDRAVDGGTLLAVRGADPRVLTNDHDRGAVGEHLPAVTARKSLASKDHILSLIDGRPYKTLRRHLASHGLTPDDYRARYGLPRDYPMVAEAYADERRQMAVKIGLGKRPS